jgi:hypothetical protein
MLFLTLAALAPLPLCTAPPEKFFGYPNQTPILPRNKAQRFPGTESPEQGEKMPIVPSMQKRHFEYIAQIIANMPDHAPSLRTQKESTARAFADACAATNSKFDYAHFLRACGIGESK